MGQAWKWLHMAATCTSLARTQSHGAAQLQGRLCSPVMFPVGKWNGAGWTASRSPPRAPSELCHLGQRPRFFELQSLALKIEITSPATSSGCEESAPPTTWPFVQ